VDRPIALGHLETHGAAFLPVGDALDDASLREQLTRTPCPYAVALGAVDGSAAHPGVVVLDGLEVGEKRPNSLGWARGVNFMLDGRHGYLHKWLLVDYQEPP
jgi:hypothetical protein